MTAQTHKEDWLLLFIGAVLTGVTLVFPSFGWLEWVSMVPIFYAAYRLCGDPATRLRRAYLAGFVTVLSYYLVLYHWFVNLYPLDFVGMNESESVVVIIVGWVGLSLLQAIPGGLIFLFFRWMHRGNLFDRLPWLRPVIFSALWVVFEWSSTLGWTGVPWGRLCLGQIEFLPMLQTASLFGSYFVSFLILLVNGFFAHALLAPRKSRVCFLVAVLLIAGNYSGGKILMQHPPETVQTVRAAVLQGNIDSHDKWGSDSLRLTVNVYTELTLDAAMDGAELIVWPETAFPYKLNERSDLSSFVSELASETGSTLAIGALRGEETHEYNSIFLVDPDGTLREETYDKRHLVPFGEYLPMRDVVLTLVPPLAMVSGLDDDTRPGTGSGLFKTEVGTIGSLVCFDSIYEQLTLQSVRDGANLLLISSNDSWFYDSAAVYQHEAQAQIRAIETGRYLVRSANTGISTIIAPDGELLGWLDPLTEGYAVADVGLVEENTLYTKIGNAFVYGCMGLAVGVLGLCFLMPKKERSPND